MFILTYKNKIREQVNRMEDVMTQRYVIISKMFRDKLSDSFVGFFRIIKSSLKK